MSLATQTRKWLSQDLKLASASRVYIYSLCYEDGSIEKQTLCSQLRRLHPSFEIYYTVHSEFPRTDFWPAIQVLNVSCTISGFPPGDVLTAHLYPHWEVAGGKPDDGRQLGNLAKAGFKTNW